MGGKKSKPSSATNYSTEESISRELTEADYQFFRFTTNLSREEINKFHSEFMKANPDGISDKQEFTRLYCKLRPEPAQAVEKICAYVFKAFDKDKNGSISFDEFLISYALTTRAEQKLKLEYAFNLYDIDNNGYLTSAEAKQVLNAMSDMLGGDRKNDSSNIANECLTQLDLNKDGKISKDEFINGLLTNSKLRSLMSPFD